MSVQILIDRLAQVRKRERTVLLAAGVFRLLLALTALCIGFFLLDWLVIVRLVETAEADRFVRGVVVAVMLGISVYVLWHSLLKEILRELDDDELALRIEDRHPDLRGRLISTLQLTRRSDSDFLTGSQELIDVLEEDTVLYSKAMDFFSIINVETLKKVAQISLAIFAVTVAAAAWKSDFSKIVLKRLLLTEVSYPTKTHIISVSPGGAVPRGNPFTVDVELDRAGLLPETVTLQTRPATGGRIIEYPLERDETVADRAVYKGEIERVLEDLDYRPIAYDAKWPQWERVTMLIRPAIKSLRLEYHFPEYTGKGIEVTHGGDIHAINGTVVKIRIDLNKPVKEAIIEERYGSEQFETRSMALTTDGRQANLEMRIEKDGGYRILVNDEKRLTNENPAEYVIDAVDDRAPMVKITFPARDRTVTRFANWPIRFEARDDFGVKQVVLKYSVLSPMDLSGDIESQGAPIFEGTYVEGNVEGSGDKEVEAEFGFDLQKLEDLQIDQHLFYWIEVKDNRQPVPNFGKSRKYEFTVRSAAVVRELLNRDRDDMLERIGSIRWKEVDNKRGVDKVRSDILDEEKEKEEEKKDKSNEKKEDE